MSLRSGVALILLLAAGCTRQSPAPGQADTQPANAMADAAPLPATPPPTAGGAVDRSHRGDVAPTAALTGVDGNPATLVGYRGKPLLVNLWATWCAPCIAEMPTVDRVAGMLDGKVAVVALNQGDDPAKVTAFLKNKPLVHARPLLDKGMAVSMTLSANLPTTILYDAAGKEVWRATGGRDWASPASLQLLGEAR